MRKVKKEYLRPSIITYGAHKELDPKCIVPSHERRK